MALSFDGTNDYINKGVVLTTRTNWTLSAWINPIALPQSFGMCVYNGADGGGGPFNGYGFGIGGDGGGSGSKLIGLYGGIAFKNTSYTFSAIDTWYHVVMRRDGSTLTYQVDGTDVGFSNSDSDNGVPSTAFTIGTQNRNSDGFGLFAVNARIAEVAAWNRHVDLAEIVSMSKGFSPEFFREDLEAYFPLYNTSDYRSRITNDTVTVGDAPANYPHPRIIRPTYYQRLALAGGTPPAAFIPDYLSLLGVS